jgi:hypothetical protein
MDAATASVKIVPLVPRVRLPRPASARTRDSVPAGYGVQEQCLPFTAANALGVLIPSPIRFGLCPPQELPAGCRAFRSPLDRPASDGRYPDARVFYVCDDADCGFVGNAYAFDGVAAAHARNGGILEPGLSFFDRDDQQSLFKLHLPYVWRTPERVDTLFLPSLNRPANGLGVQCGLVETDWYASPVNLILSKPSGSIHVQAGDVVAQAILVPRDLRRIGIEEPAEHARIIRETRKGLSEWNNQLAKDRNAYKVLARSHHGRVDFGPSSGPSSAADGKGRRSSES